MPKYRVTLQRQIGATSRNPFLANIESLCTLTHERVCEFDARNEIEVRALLAEARQTAPHQVYGYELARIECLSDSAPVDSKQDKE